jgi:hypothetical protein
VELEQVVHVRRLATENARRTSLLSERILLAGSLIRFFVLRREKKHTRARE